MDKKAEKLFNDGNKQEAIKLLVADLNKNPKQLSEILQLSTYLVQSEDLEQAEELLARSLEMFKDNQDLLYNLGNVYYLADKYDKANQIFQNLIDDNYAFEAYFMMAKTLDQQGKRQLAIMYALTAAEKAPKDLQANEL
ncbi:tetratricopeptide repeat protein [Companilactobacillus bobalius]|nr:tetratricopeptide repeat protein [Companilactobacillus bobalius]